ncbi:MAG TPA: hypothetical protein PKY81_17070 [bacterium]|nr:hypothetical protein [bacterium]HPN32667.1 hypothetical protein [bacterium]
MSYSGFHWIWGIINFFNATYVIYMLFFKINFYFDPDNMDYTDQRNLLHLILLELFLWGNALLWCEPLTFFVLIIPLLYFWSGYIRGVKIYITKMEMVFILWIFISFLITIIGFYMTGQLPKNFDRFAQIFLFRKYTVL